MSITQQTTFFHKVATTYRFSVTSLPSHKHTTKLMLTSIMLKHLVLVFAALAVVVSAANNRFSSGGPQATPAKAKNGPSPLPIENWAGKRVMFITAHVDDMEGTSGGLVSLLKGIAEVSVIIMTNGDKGCGNPDLCTNATNLDVAVIRQREQLNSAAILGIDASNVHILVHEDCLLHTYHSIKLQEEVVGYIRKMQPHVVLTWDPQPYFNLVPSEGWQDLGFHPDHQTSGNLALHSAWVSHLARLWPQNGDPWKVEELYFFSISPTNTPDYYVDITGAALEAKIQAFGEMKSQFTADQEWEIKAYMELIGARIANQVGLPLGRFAEAFIYVLQ
jgi:LmbE family N-acetylglucosaminyl deacetylase